mgnify:CR=1 FL=1
MQEQHKQQLQNSKGRHGMDVNWERRQVVCGFPSRRAAAPQRSFSRWLDSIRGVRNSGLVSSPSHFTTASLSCNVVVLSGLFVADLIAVGVLSSSRFG